MLKKLVKSLTYQFCSKKIDYLYKLVDSYDYISFDIFDTLIKRNVNHPTDIFEIIGKKVGVHDFKTKRIFAEQKVILMKLI